MLQYRLIETQAFIRHAYENVEYVRCIPAPLQHFAWNAALAIERCDDGRNALDLEMPCLTSEEMITSVPRDDITQSVRRAYDDMFQEKFPGG